MPVLNYLMRTCASLQEQITVSHIIKTVTLNSHLVLPIGFSLPFLLRRLLDPVRERQNQ